MCFYFEILKPDHSRDTSFLYLQENLHLFKIIKKILCFRMIYPYLNISAESPELDETQEQQKTDRLSESSCHTSDATLTLLLLSKLM